MNTIALFIFAYAIGFIVHELAHWLAAAFFGIPRRFVIHGLRFGVQYGSTGVDIPAYQKLNIALAGPAASLAWAGFCFSTADHTGRSLGLYLALASVDIGLLALATFDGRHAVRYAREMLPRNIQEQRERSADIRKRVLPYRADERP